MDTSDTGDTSDTSSAAAPTAWRPRVVTVVLATVLVFLGQFAAGAVVGVAAAITLAARLRGGANLADEVTKGIHAEVTRAPWLLIGLVLTSGVLITLSMAIAKLSPQPWALRIGWRRTGPALSTSLAAFLSVVALVGVLSVSLVLDALSIHVAVFDRIAQATYDASTPVFVALMITGGLVAPFAEELFFRGVLQTRLVARCGPAIGIGLASVAFGAFHFDPAHAAFATFFGLVAGVLAHWSGSIRLPILVHMTNNLLSFAIARQAPPAPVGTPASTLMVVEAVGAVVLVVVAAAGALHAFRSGRLVAYRDPAED